MSACHEQPKSYVRNLVRCSPNEQTLASVSERPLVCHSGIAPLARNDRSLAFGSRRSTGKVDPCPRRIALCCSRFRMVNCWISPAPSRCLRVPMTSYRVRCTASRSPRHRQGHLQRRPAFGLLPIFHLRKSRINASLVSTHSSRLAVSRACVRSLRAETQQTSCLGRLDECHVSPLFAAAHFS